MASGCLRPGIVATGEVCSTRNPGCALARGIANGLQLLFKWNRDLLCAHEAAFRG